MVWGCAYELDFFKEGPQTAQITTAWLWMKKVQILNCSVCLRKYLSAVRRKGKRLNTIEEMAKCTNCLGSYCQELKKI